MPTAHWVAVGCAGSASQFVGKWRHLLCAVCNTATTTSWRSHRVRTRSANLLRTVSCPQLLANLTAGRLQCRYVCPSVHMEQFGSHPAGFQKKNYVRGCWLKFVETIQTCLNPDKNYTLHVKAYVSSWWDIIIGREVRAEAEETAEHQATFILNVGRRLLKHIDCNFSCLRYIDDYRLYMFMKYTETSQFVISALYSKFLRISYLGTMTDQGVRRVQLCGHFLTC